jgi:hypothetical protein
MKKTMINVSLALILGLAFTNCSSEKAAETSNAKIVCDSVDAVSYDENGQEIIEKVSSCDTVKNMQYSNKDTVTIGELKKISN